MKKGTYILRFKKHKFYIGEGTHTKLALRYPPATENVEYTKTYCLGVNVNSDIKYPRMSSLFEKFWHRLRARLVPNPLPLP